MNDLDVLRKELGPIVDMVDTIISVKSIGFEEERDRIVDEMWRQIKSRIDKYGEEETRLALSFLAVVMKRTIEYSIVSEDFHIVINNINEYLKSELLDRNSKKES